MPAEFIYRRDAEDGVETRIELFPDESPETWPPVGAVLLDYEGVWKCIGRAKPAEADKEGASCS